MNELNHRECELVALGAAMGSNCLPCIEYHISEARKAGLTDAQIAAVIRLADKVRQVPARKVLDTAHRVLGESAGAVCGSGEPGEPVETAKEVAAGKPCCD